MKSEMSQLFEEQRNVHVLYSYRKLPVTAFEHYSRMRYFEVFVCDFLESNLLGKIKSFFKPRLLLGRSYDCFKHGRSKA